MSKTSGVEPVRRDALAADAAASAFQQFSAATERLLQMQAQLAAVALSESATRYAQTVNGLLRDRTLQGWGRVHRAAVESVLDPMDAWIDVVTGFQAIMLVALVEAGTLFAVQARPLAREWVRIGDEDAPNRRIVSVVIPFPDRRRSAVQ